MELVIENIQTGERAVMTEYAARLLSPTHKVIGKAELVSQTKQPDFTPPSNETEIEKLRKQYKALFNAEPHHNLKEAKLRQLIQEKLASQNG